MSIALRLFFIWVVLFPHITEARSLFWQDIDVRANLDAEGALHIREQQTMVFSGAWNGGERTFRILPGQRMKFGSISRLDADGREIPLIRGNLKLVDHWDHNGQKTIRWRSRLPVDPVFNNTSITYIIRYSLSHILLSGQNGYRLNHDFCFPDRSGIVKEFRLNLDFDPVWERPPLTLSQKNIASGQGVVVRQHLSFSGQTKPTIFTKQAALPRRKPPAPVSPAPDWLRFSLLAVVVLWVLWRIILFFKWERSLGRFGRVIPLGSVNEQWLAEELFVHKPEVVGATWDKATSTAEVAAVLARLVQEGKMESWMEPYLLPFFNFPIPGMPPILHLKLLQPRESFLGMSTNWFKGYSWMTAPQQIPELFVTITGRNERSLIR